jgi:hypothetical protein
MGFPSSSCVVSLQDKWFLARFYVRLAVRAQPVDATPLGIKLFSKVVFMTQGKRFGLSAAQKSDMWCHWKAGQSLHEIGRAFGKNHSSIRSLVSHHGGFVPAVPRRSLLALTLREPTLACSSV